MRTRSSRSSSLLYWATAETRPRRWWCRANIQLWWWRESQLFSIKQLWKIMCNCQVTWNGEDKQQATLGTSSGNYRRGLVGLPVSHWVREHAVNLLANSTSLLPPQLCPMSVWGLTAVITFFSSGTLKPALSAPRIQRCSNNTFTIRDKK